MVWAGRALARGERRSLPKRLEKSYRRMLMSMASTEIAVLHSSAAYRRGLAACLREQGMRLVEPTDVMSWARTVGDGAALIHLADGRSQALMDELVPLPVTTVALVEHLDVESFADALSHGADGVVHVDTSPEMICHVLSSAIGGEVVLPSEAARQLARHMRSATTIESPLNADEIHLLQRLSDGATIPALAAELFLSERSMRRRVQNVCLKLGANSRSSAIKRAAMAGLIE